MWVYSDGAENFIGRSHCIWEDKESMVLLSLLVEVDTKVCNYYCIHATRRSPRISAHPPVWPKVHYQIWCNSMWIMPRYFAHPPLSSWSGWKCSARLRAWIQYLSLQNVVFHKEVVSYNRSFLRVLLYFRWCFQIHSKDGFGTVAVQQIAGSPVREVTINTTSPVGD